MHKKQQSRNIFSHDNCCWNQRVLSVFTQMLPGHCSVPPPLHSICGNQSKACCSFLLEWKLAGTAQFWCSWPLLLNLLNSFMLQMAGGAKEQKQTCPFWASPFLSHLSSHSEGSLVSFHKTQIDLASTAWPTWGFLFRNCKNKCSAAQSRVTLSCTGTLERKHWTPSKTLTRLK